jgi:four helix bundle protein
MDHRNQHKLLIVNKAHQLVLAIYKNTKTWPKEEKYSLVDQIRRAAVSVPSNIIEGNARNSNKEFLQYLYIARGSLLEVQYQLRLAHDLNYIHTTHFEHVNQTLIETSKMLTRLLITIKQRIK